jgi:hypothetical protein
MVPVISPAYEDAHVYRVTRREQPPGAEGELIPYSSTLCFSPFTQLLQTTLQAAGTLVVRDPGCAYIHMWLRAADGVAVRKAATPFHSVRTTVYLPHVVASIQQNVSSVSNLAPSLGHVIWSHRSILIWPPRRAAWPRECVRCVGCLAAVSNVVVGNVRSTQGLVRAL